MIYPKFINDKSIIAVTAPSDGVANKQEQIRLDKAKINLENNGYFVIETENVRKSNNNRSSSPKERAHQLEELFLNKEVDLIVAASGGDFIMEMIPYLNYEVIKKNPKWFQGYSDPTWLTYIITTNFDIATVYSNNYKAFSMMKMHKSLIDNLDILRGVKVVQTSFDKYEKEKCKEKEDYNLTDKVIWKILTGEKEVNVNGRMIGGCLDVLGDIFGTKYDNTLSFIEKYKEDGIIWYFENFSLSSENITRLLWKFKEHGYFKYTRGIIFGRCCMYTSIYDKLYEETIFESLKELNVPIVIDADIGHLAPRMTIINGALAIVEVKNGKGSIEFEFK